MIILLLTILFLIIGIGFLVAHKLSNDWYNDFDIYGIAICLFTGIILFTEVLILVFKPIDYKKFKIGYDVIKETITSAEDIRDTNYTEKLIGINTEIMKNREFKDNILTGIFYNEKIAELELLEK